VALAGKETKQAIPQRTAWLTSTLLRHVVTHGHAPAIRNAAILAAGKTGTSSATMDVWFIGYTSRWMTTAWVGDDLRERPLGAKDAAFMITVPMFARYINEVAVGQPLSEIPWQRPATVKPGDTGGKVRTTVDEVLADGKGPPPPPPRARPQAPAKPAGAKPATAKPATPAMATPATAKPTANKPAAARPATSKPGGAVFPSAASAVRPPAAKPRPKKPTRPH